jgi:DNA-directed RNA polymerase I subunit RPA2
MTIAMMVECMAGKSGANHGLCHDATPFRYVSDDLKDTDAINHFGKQLEAAGYNYYGTETLYSGTDGIQMTADIFFGIIHYQRLRHMVSDKFQVRSQGPVDMVTRQPIKGRRRGGGVRFGEMERDCLLSHGSVFLLQDRLFHGSDKTRVKVCIKCGSLLSPRVAFPATKNAVPPSMTNRFRELKSECLVCQEGASTVRDLAVPYVFLHLVSQLAAVNIKIRVETKYE